MNKKVLTLAFGQTFDKEMTKDGTSADYYNVYVQDNGEVKGGSGILSPEAPFYVEATEANKNDAKFQWKITRATLGGKTYYTLVNAAGTEFPVVKTSDGKEYKGFIVSAQSGEEDELIYSELALRSPAEANPCSLPPFFLSRLRHRVLSFLTPS